MDKLAGLVRPAVMLILVSAQVWLAVAWAAGLERAEPAFAGLGAFTMMVVTYLFRSRDAEKAAAADAARNADPPSATPN
jgi:hypothetical protein